MLTTIIKRIWDLITERSFIWKVALAAGIAWEAAQFTGTKRPYFAPLAAILSMQVTVEESMWRGYQRIVGIIGGILVADFTARYVGIHGWSIGLLVLVGTSLATWLKLGQQAIPQVGVSALMVLTIGTGREEYSLDRIADTVIGVAVAVAINILIVPPDYSKQAQQSMTEATEQLSKRFAAISTWLRKGAALDAGMQLQDVTRGYVEELHQTYARVDQAIRALHYSPLVRKRRKRLEVIRADLLRLRQGYAHASGMLRTLIEWKQAGPMAAEEMEEWGSAFETISRWIADWSTQFSTTPVERGKTAETMRSFSQRFQLPQADPSEYQLSLLHDMRQITADFRPADVPIQAKRERPL